jgi:hypothetical protein
VQRVPALGTPPLRDLSAFDDHVVDPELGQAVAHREPCLTGADDESVRAFHGTAQRVLMVRSTGTPLVSTSYTAERARDCSTICRSFSGGASPAIVNVMRMRS